MSESEDKDSPKIKIPNVTLGINMATAMVVFVYGGSCIDKWKGTNGAFTFLGLFLGFVYCAYEVWKYLKQNENTDVKK